MTGACDHDWRADPEGYVYTSNPPSRRIVCAKCGARSFQMAPLPESVSRDPHDWPKADAKSAAEGGELSAASPSRRTCQKCDRRRLTSWITIPDPWTWVRVGLRLCSECEASRG